MRAVDTTPEAEEISDRMATLLTEATARLSRAEASSMVLGLFIGYFAAVCRNKADERYIIGQAQKGLRGMIAAAESAKKGVPHG